MTGVPDQFCPSPRELDDLELLLNGGLAPQVNFDDGPVRLELPAELVEADEVELVDPEGLPLAVWTPDRFSLRMPLQTMTGERPCRPV